MSICSSASRPSQDKHRTARHRYEDVSPPRPRQPDDTAAGPSPAGISTEPTAHEYQRHPRMHSTCIGRQHESSAYWCGDPIRQRTPLGAAAYGQTPHHGPDTTHQDSYERRCRRLMQAWPRCEEPLSMIQNTRGADRYGSCRMSWATRRPKGRSPVFLSQRPNRPRPRGVDIRAPRA